MSRKRMSTHSNRGEKPDPPWIAILVAIIGLMGIFSALPPDSWFRQSFFPTATPPPTTTPTPPPTTVTSQGSTVLFEDDFESGMSTWQTADKQWGLQTETSGNTLLCVNSVDTHTYASAGSTTWADYALVVDVIMRRYSNDGFGGLMIVHITDVAPHSWYEYTFITGGAYLVKGFLESNSQPRFESLDSTYQKLEIGRRYTVRIEVRRPGIKVFQERTLTAMYSDPSYVERGAIRLGASPGSEVCFDNVKVIALPAQTTPVPPTATTSQAPTILFEDNFEKSASQWKTEGDGDWELRKEAGNTLYCISSKGGHNYSYAGSDNWMDYALQVDMIMRRYGTNGYGGLMSMHIAYNPTRFYEYTFSDQGAVLTRYVLDLDPQSKTYQLQSYSLGLTKETATLGQRHAIRIEVRRSGIRALQDGRLVMQVSDPFYVAQGGIRLGGTPDSQVCFDNVKVIALSD